MKKTQNSFKNRKDSRKMLYAQFVQKLRIFAFWFQKLAFSPTFAFYDHSRRNLIKIN